MSQRPSPERAALTCGALLAVLSCAGEDAERADLEPGEERPGGAATNTLLLGENAFALPAPTASEESRSQFFSGNGFFNQPWVEAPSSTATRDGLGPLFNARSCSACHFRDGRGRPPAGDDEPFLGLLLRLALPGHGDPGAPPTPEPSYGDQLQPFANPGVPAEGRPRVVYAELPGRYADGTPYTLRRPVYSVESLGYGPLAPDTRISPRVAQAVFGLGLLEAIPAQRLLALADPDDRDRDGISGKINRVPDLRQGGVRAIGRFGWKAEQPSLRQQSAAAFLGDIGITSAWFPDESCTPVQLACRAALAGGSPEVADTPLDRVERYLQLLAVPARRQARSEEVLRGKWLFARAGCARCHVPRHETGELPGVPELARQTIWPYTDLLLHDLGEELADHRPSFDADGREWRTPPLWGLGLTRVVSGHELLLHDGRARGVAEAILWHGGEAARAREAFRALPASDRRALIAFVESL